VLEQPAVQRAVTREADRQTRQRIEQMDQAPSRTERAREQRRTSVTVKKMFWTDLYVALTHAARLLNDATSELDRTGMPAGRSGDILKASRVVEKAAKRFSAAATLRAVGAPMDDTGTA
jgi:hypothetical protein